MTPAEKITEQQVQDYFLYRRNKDNWSAATLRIAQSGIKFFFTNVLKRKWHTFNYLNAKRERRLPCILSRIVSDSFEKLLHGMFCLFDVFR